MARGVSPKVTVTWQRKNPTKPYGKIKLVYFQSKGLNECASWLQTSKPSEVLEDLRNYQAEWCSHVFNVVAFVNKEGNIKRILCCSVCSKVEISTKAFNG